MTQENKRPEQPPIVEVSLEELSLPTDLSNLPEPWKNYMEKVSKGEINLVITGSQGSGKTSYMAALLKDLQKEDSIKVIESNK